MFRTSADCIASRTLYDVFGNLTQLAGSTVSIDAATNRLNGSGMAYDVFGSMTQQPVGTETYRYDYDEVQMLRSLERLNGAQLLRTDYYVYDANDERVRTYTDEGGSISSTYVIRDLGGRSLREWREAGNTWTLKDDYVYGPGGLTAAYTGTTLARVHFHNDHLGTPRLVTGAGGSVYERSNYFAFGREATPYLSTDLTKKFTGHHRDMYTAQHNLDYMHARYYSAGLGRFLSTDPGRDWNARAPQSWNLYGYVRNNPLNGVDPDGMFFRQVVSYVKEVFSGDTLWATATVHAWDMDALRAEQDAHDTREYAAWIAGILNVSSARSFYEGLSYRRAGNGDMLGSFAAEALLTLLPDSRGELALDIGMAIIPGGKITSSAAKQIAKQAAKTGGRAGSKMLISLARRMGLEVVAGGKHLRVIDSAGNLVTEIPHSLTPGALGTAKDAVGKMIERAGLP